MQKIQRTTLSEQDNARVASLARSIVRFGVADGQTVGVRLNEASGVLNDVKTCGAAVCAGGTHSARHFVEADLKLPEDYLESREDWPTDKVCWSLGVCRF